jgi:hypothetical protein
MSNPIEFWRYAEEAMLSARHSKTDNERQAQLDLAHTWTQAALRSESEGPAKYCPPAGRVS